MDDDAFVHVADLLALTRRLGAAVPDRMQYMGMLTWNSWFPEKWDRFGFGWTHRDALKSARRCRNATWVATRCGDGCGACSGPFPFMAGYLIVLSAPLAAHMAGALPAEVARLGPHTERSLVTNGGYQHSRIFEDIWLGSNPNPNPHPHPHPHPNPNPNPNQVLSAVADDADHADPEFSVGDTITLHLDRATNRGGGRHDPYVVYGNPPRWMPLEGGKDFVDTLLSFDHKMGDLALHLALALALAPAPTLTLTLTITITITIPRTLSLTPTLTRRRLLGRVARPIDLRLHGPRHRRRPATHGGADRRALQPGLCVGLPGQR